MSADNSSVRSALFTFSDTFRAVIGHVEAEYALSCRLKALCSDAECRSLAAGMILYHQREGLLVVKSKDGFRQESDGPKLVCVKPGASKGKTYTMNDLIDGTTMFSAGVLSDAKNLDAERHRPPA